MRNALEAVLEALRVPRRHPGRTAITMLGLAIGVAAFIATVSFGRAARSSVSSQFASLGVGIVRVRPQYSVNRPAPHPVDDQDLAQLRRLSTTVDLIVPSYVRSLSVAREGRTHRVDVTGVPASFLLLREEAFSLGGAYDQGDEEARSRVCLLGETTARALFGTASPIAQEIVIDQRMICRVIGVFQARGTNLDGNDQDDRVYMPLATYREQIGSRDGYTLLQLRLKDRLFADATRDEVTSILRESHGLTKGEPDDFFVISPDQTIRLAENISSVLTNLLTAVAAISLLVGGIGIMNIQLMSVAERVHEIGVRAAIGAAPHQILGQFLLEALVLASLGSLLGASFGMAASWVVSYRVGLSGLIQGDVIAGAFAFGVFIGTIFGYIPARRAAALDPIDALRRD